MTRDFRWPGGTMEKGTAFSTMVEENLFLPVGSAGRNNPERALKHAGELAEVAGRYDGIAFALKISG
jgi:hypothetical protein